VAKTLVAGVDDAGRGAVIGPLIIAGILLNDRQLITLKEIGVKDSKALSPSRRLELSFEVKKLSAEWDVVELPPSVIDKVVLNGRKYHKLNWLEAKAMATVISKLRPDIAYVDASDVNTTRFANQIAELVSFKLQIISEHHADSTYPIVSAASIIAKVYRDTIIDSLHKKFGDFGSGYSSDEKTRQFIANWIKTKKNIPNFVRRSWKTVRRLL
jgi:ribonuclease HII